ncbi:sensor histidine kinase [Hansschlegelia beijingensis]|uniref:histidine kinase n=1 Tax=Hansschlegelia beijingensis TaxID=1133344 RepID=A0A7W6CXE9_9HYPH|nr:sensor histidine kinase [Hansschlegelia beijingensis]MBB3972880.1 signal transduction histidine kinase [Hansschlegelia beijingensis]
MTRSLGRDSAVRNEILMLILGFAALVAVGGATVWLVSKSDDFNRQVATTLETKNEIVRTLSLAQDAETGQRGYLLTGEERYLRPYRSSLEKIDDHFRRLGELIGPDGPQRQDFETVRATVRDKFAELAETVGLSTSGRRAEAQAIVLSDRGREAMVQIRQLVSRMTAREDATLAERTEDAARLSNGLLAVVVLGLVIAAALAFVAQLLVRRQTRVLAAAQQELAQANHGLEAAVAERTSELLAANGEIQRFAYIVSHDLRAPLVNVMGFTSELDAARGVLKEQLDELTESVPDKIRPEAREAVEVDLPEAISFIRTSTAKMDRLINAILRLSREGRRVVTPESVSVTDMANAIAATLHQQTAGVGAEIVVDPSMPALVTDRLSIEQIFQNLIENAVKYLDPARPGRIEIRGRRVGPQVEYTIEDNGRGIDAKDHERVFELFRRAGAQDKPGEGLGLAFVRASVRRLGGTISLTSEPGKGSTFHLTFPAVLRPQTETQAAA